MNDYRHLVNSSVLGNRLSPTGDRVYEMVVISDKPYVPSSFWLVWPRFVKPEVNTSWPFPAFPSLGLTNRGPPRC